MIKKSFIILGIAAAYFANAQDISTNRNTADVYSNSSSTGTAKYNAMAGSMGALGGDFSVMNTNPAGIGVNITSEMSGTLSIQKNNNSTSLAGKSLDYTINKTDLSNVGGVMAFQLDGSTPWKFVNIGVNYSNQSIEDYSETPGNNNVNFDIYDSTNALIDNVALSGHAYNRYGDVSKMSVAVGGNYDNRIYVGAGLNFHSAAIDQYDSAAFTSSLNGSTSVYDKQYTPFSESSTGFSASVGVIGKINPQFRLGASVETPTWWSIARVYNEYDNPTDGTYTEDRNLSTPMKATVSAAYVPNKNFAINVDYSLGLTKPKYKVYGDAERELNNFFSDHSKSLSEVKIGAEYRIAALRLRGGYGFASSPFDSMNISAFSDNGTATNTSFDNLIVGKRTTIGAGIGYDFKSFYIDAAYQNLSSDYKSPFLRGSATSNTGYFSDNYIVDSDAAVVSTVKNKKDNFFITLGWKF
ncbi:MULTISPECIES: OmpP1/FadL family transporter [unclassified Kaistella]|uniref:OmpP1/FadL family transporter n=1 Tax=unclassified Kaistella TaxID=2762626 RepID=UPI0027364827|nr:MULTISPECIES: hemin receptor [unclassified Kaistella]MDP2454580.1 hemin receptor [Kaistella sp. SH11-4b]MDP2457318.1 hemin receptor [Kaistella sp. SH40-3]MDP2460078.1 hemin receptor [Kaistella sp. SH19-2b]